MIPTISTLLGILLTFLKELITINMNYKIISLDNVSLFSNKPFHLFKSSIGKKWNRIEEHWNFNQNHLIEILNNTYFLYNEVFYKQIIGSVIGATLLPMVAQYVMDQLLSKVLIFSIHF